MFLSQTIARVVHNVIKHRLMNEGRKETQTEQDREEKKNKKHSVLFRKQGMVIVFLMCSKQRL